MQDADGPPEQVDQWRLVIDAPDRWDYRRRLKESLDNYHDAWNE